MSTKVQSRDNSCVPSALGTQLSPVDMNVRPRIQRRVPSVPSTYSTKSTAATPPALGRSTLSKDRLKSNRPPAVPFRNSSTKARQPSAERVKPTPSEQSDEEEDHVKLINVSSARSSSNSNRSREKHAQKINPEDILERSQEHTYDHVYQADLHASQIARIENLDKFTRLRVLDLSCNHIQKIENLHNNTDLRELKLYDNNIVKIENLDQLKQLQHLQLQHNKIRSIGKGLLNQRKLHILRLDSNQICQLDVRDLASCGQLTSLDISNNKLENISAISCLTSLEELVVINNRLRTISDLSRCKKLQEVNVSYNKLTDLSGLKSLQQLTSLHASHNQLVSLKSLGKIRGLQELNIKHNKVTELKPIVDSFAGLQILDISENHVELWEQVEFLKQLQELVELYISDNPFGAENGSKPSYHTELSQLLPNLDILDGAHMKRPSGRVGTPLMRPMSASSVITSRQVETQMKRLDEEMAEFEKSVTSRFESLRASMMTLPKEAVSHSELEAHDLLPEASRPVSRSRKRSRIKVALEFAAKQYDERSDCTENI